MLQHNHRYTKPMEFSSVLNQRLHNTGLSGAPFSKAQDVVAHLGAVQAQDYGPAKWGLSLRTAAAADEEIEKAFNDGAILRTHIMRPTWHFVTPEDIRWIQALTAQRVHTKNRSRYRQLELNEETLTRCHKLLAGMLAGENYLTRTEIAGRLEARGIAARGQRLAYIIMHAELEGLLCSGPRRGKQFTYALLAERAPQAGLLDRDEGLARLAFTYFKSHGPAQVQDFSWWSGLTVKEALVGRELIKTELEEYILEGKSYWSAGPVDLAVPVTAVQPQAALISVYDEYIIGYADRSAFLAAEDAQQIAAIGNALLTSLIIINGRVAGTWKRTINKNVVEIQLFPFHALQTDEQRLVEEAAGKFGRFLHKEVLILPE